VTAPEWVVVFEVAQPKPVDPVVHIHVLVRGISEGDAAVAGFRWIETFISDINKVRYLEAAIKPQK